MRIVYLTDQVYLAGGAEKILTQKVNYWADVLDCDVLLITSDQLKKLPFYKLSEKVKHHDLEMGYPSGSLYHPKNIGRFREQYQKLKVALQSFQPDAVFVVSQRIFHSITPFAAKGFPTYFEYHTSWYGYKLTKERLPLAYQIKEKAIRKWLDFVESKYTHIVYLNQSEFDYFKKKNGLIIPNFFDYTEPPKNAVRKKIAVSLGRLTFQKGYDLLIDTWAGLDAKVEGWEMHVYGEGEDRQKLEAQLTQHQFRNPFIFQPEIRHVGEKLDEAAVYVMSSRFETFPMVLLEALSHGLPVVSFDCPSGPSSILIPGEDSVLAEPMDTKALASALITVMQDENKRAVMSEKALENVRRFSPEHIMKLWYDLVRSNSRAV
ncbi:glycosyltransferase family 4 protein [Flavobacterium silvaticum]|uniref:Glycosyltransferase family 4 protein n=1 Tax=Flavobacterium silvaticum TaxID=1852020 RepID=A0A972FUE3_9FLAO|nr:glycosyltransferase family 4 protein [Flavobacterium silvaticum]NMH29509.1 glycosyltransferase family 4 protein [Flavobacterium silvaticum]